MNSKDRKRLEIEKKRADGNYRGWAKVQNKVYAYEALYGLLPKTFTPELQAVVKASIKEAFNEPR